jgi:hypothetical protein
MLSNEFRSAAYEYNSRLISSPHVKHCISQLYRSETTNVYGPLSPHMHHIPRIAQSRNIV